VNWGQHPEQKKKEFHLSLRMLLDEDSQAKYLVNLLQTAGHDVLTVNEAAGYTIKNQFVILNQWHY
jgi:uncharacterized protein YeaO (DUF488 family)